MTLIYILIATFSISLIAFIGVLALFLRQEILNKILLALVSFSAGGLFGGAFLHLLPESIEELGLDRLLEVFLFLIFGFSVFFILEQFISWHHHHNCVSCQKTAPFSYLVLISDGIHNFIDGLVIAASFVVSLPMGMITVLAVALHEIPQEIGDFGVLVYGGMKKSRALILNFLSGLVAMAGGIIGFFLSGEIGNSIVFLLPFAAGNFIYISASDLIPEIKQKKQSRDCFLCFFVFLLGIILMLLFKFLF